MGIIGIVVAFIIFIAKLASIECLGTSYLTPVSPLYIKSIKQSIFRINRKKIKNRPDFLTNNLKRLDDE